MARMALKIGCMDFDDKHAGKDFNWAEVKGDKSSWAYTKGFGFLPILERDDFFVT